MRFSVSDMEYAYLCLFWVCRQVVSSIVLYVADILTKTVPVTTPRSKPYSIYRVKLKSSIVIYSPGLKQLADQ